VDRVSDWKYCSQWLDDAPFVRAECKEHLEKGRSCENCQHRNIRQEVMDLRAALREGVPREPTEAMIQAGFDVANQPHFTDYFAAMWRAMYDAAQEGTP
jgi:hypothetical protein